MITSLLCYYLASKRENEGNTVEHKNSRYKWAIYITTKENICHPLKITEGDWELANLFADCRAFKKIAFDSNQQRH